MTRYKSIDLFEQPVITFEVIPYLSAITIAQNVPIISYINICNPSLNDYTNVRIFISFAPSLLKSHFIEIDCIPNETAKRIENICVEHCDDFIRSLDCPQECQVDITVTCNEFEDCQQLSRLTVLDDNSWVTSQEHIQILPHYIKEEYKNVDILFRSCFKNSRLLSNEASASNFGFEKEQQLYSLSCIAYSAIGNLKVSLKEPDQPFLDRIQSVKSYTELVETKSGSIVDIVCLYSALLQQLGLDNAVVISDDAMWVVVRLGGSDRAAGLLGSCDPIYRMSLLPVDVTGLDSENPGDFWSAIKKGCERHFDQRGSSIRRVVEIEAEKDVNRHVFSSDDLPGGRGKESPDNLRHSEELGVDFLSEYDPHVGQAGGDPLRTSASNVGEGLRRIVESEGPMLDIRAFELYTNGIGLQHLDEERSRALNRALRGEIDSGHILTSSEMIANGNPRRIIRSSHVAPIFPRVRGSRPLSQIPIHELQFAARLLLLDARLELSWCSENHLRCLAVMYGLADRFLELKGILNDEFPYQSLRVE